VVERLNKEFTRRCVAGDARAARAHGRGAGADHPGQFPQFVRSELAKYEKVVKFSGARVD
jgi:hypothetical protein